MTFFDLARDPVSFETHFWGAVAALFGTAALLTKALLMSGGDVYKVIGAGVFGLSLAALYSASSIYHFISWDAQKWLRKLDHSMIYVLIAGTYTPVFMNYADRGHAAFFTAYIWGFAAIGIAAKLIHFNIPRWLTSSIYLFMGWSVLFDIPGFLALPLGAIIFIALGGIIYTIGAVIYALKKPNISKRFGFHEIFHLFVLAGSLCHFIAVLGWLV